MDSKEDALIEMKITVVIQEEGYFPYTLTIGNGGTDPDYPYDTHLSRPGLAGLSAEFESPATVGEFCGQYIKDYIEKTEEDEKIRK